MRMLSVSLLAVVPAVFAAPDGSNSYRDETIVTAARIPVTVGESGSSVSVINRTDIEERSPIFLTDLLRDVPGLAVSRLGGSGKLTNVRVRGAESNQVLVLIDGIEANDISGDDAFDFSHLQASGIERVEIVRGPQSALWGSDALAGVINIVTTQSDKPWQADVATEAGSFGTLRTNANLGAAGPNYHGNLGLGYYDSRGTNTSRNGAEADGYRNGTLNLKLDWQPLQRLRLDFSGRLVDARNEHDNDLGLGIPSDTPGVSRVFQSYVGTRAQLSTFDGHWVHSVNWTWSRNDNQDKDPAVFQDGSTAGDKYAVNYQSTWNFATPGFLDAQHVFTAALNYEKQEFKQRGPVTVFGDPNQDRAYDMAGYIGEYRLRLAEVYLLSASARYDDNSAFADIGTYRLSFTREIPQTGTSVGVSYGTGQKNPTFIERFGFSSGGLFSPTFIGNASLRPEQSKGWELRVNQALFADKLLLGATYFHEQLQDEINGFVVDPTFTLATALNLNGTSKRQGVELSTQARLSSQVSLNAAYTYLDSTQIDASTRRRVDEIRRPHHQGSVSLNLVTSDRRGNLNLHLSYSGEQVDDIFLPPFFAPARARLDPIPLAGVSASYRIAPYLTLFGRVENMFNERYEEVFGFRGEGVSAFLGVRLHTARE